MAIGRLGTGFGRMGAASAASASSGPANAETTTWVNAVVGDGGTVSAGRQTAVDTLISSLKSASVWTKLDRLWLFAAENSQSALRDIVAASAATATSSPTFTIDRGYAGNASNAYIGTNFNPATAGGQFTQNSGSIGAWDLTNRIIAAAKGLMGNSGGGGSELIYLMPKFTGDVTYGGINSVGFMNAASASSLGFWITTRTASNVEELYLNGASFASGVNVSSAIFSANIDILREGAVSPRYTDDQAGCAFIGGGLTSGNASALYSALLTYMQAVGAA